MLFKNPQTIEMQALQAIGNNELIQAQRKGFIISFSLFCTIFSKFPAGTTKLLLAGEIHSH